jgi:hypothetical protein
LKGDNTFYNLPYVECEGIEVTDRCNTIDAAYNITFESATHRKPENNWNKGYITMEVLNESDHEIIIRKGEAIGRLLGGRDSLQIVEECSVHPERRDKICTISPHKAFYYNKRELTQTLLQTGIDIQNTEESADSVIDDIMDVDLQEGRVEVGLQNLTLGDTELLPEKMAESQYHSKLGGQPFSETLGCGSYSGIPQLGMREGTPSHMPIDKVPEVLTIMVQDVGLLVDEVPSNIQVSEGLYTSQEDPKPDDKVAEYEILSKLTQEADCSPIQREQLKEILIRNVDIFSNNLKLAGQAMMFPHAIRLNTDIPLWTAQHRRSHKENEVIDMETKKLAKQEVVRQSKSPYNSPVMVVKKKDGGWRTVIDYRKINNITIKESHPIPRADEAFDALSEANYITTLDFTSGYWQIPIREEDKQKTAYSTSSGRWEYNVLPMGLTNAPAAFQKNMETMLAGLTWKSCIVYIDDVIIYSKTFQDHLKHLQEVFDRLKTYNVNAKPQKCKFAKKEAEYLGHVVGRGMLRPNKANIDKVRNARLPTNVKEIRQFNGIASYTRKFIPGYAKIMKPLTELMSDKKQGGKKKGTISLSPEAIGAYEKIKSLLTSEPVLMLPNFNRQF